MTNEEEVEKLAKVLGYYCLQRDKDKGVCLIHVSMSERALNAGYRFVEKELVPLDEDKVDSFLALNGLVGGHSPACSNDTLRKRLVSKICDKFGTPSPTVLSCEDIEKILESKFRMVEGITVCEGDKEYEHYVDFGELALAIHQKLIGGI